MARTRNTISIDQKIEKARLHFEKVSAKYDTAAKDLKDLMAKKEAIRKDELMKAIAKSDKSYDEIMAFLGC